MKLLKILFRMTFMPVVWTIRLMIAAIAFVLSISTSLLSIVASIFTLLAVVMFIIGSNGNAFTLLILAALISPMGLPAIADKLLDLMDSVLTRVTAIMY
ncbi:MAG: hypothetical protein J6M20_04270 [Clostridia bacterium]|nr:hypothetical protein [Clostridia bacterium]